MPRVTQLMSGGAETQTQACLSLDMLFMPCYFAYDFLFPLLPIPTLLVFEKSFFFKKGSALSVLPVSIQMQRGEGDHPCPDR